MSLFDLMGQQRPQQGQMDPRQMQAEAQRAIDDIRRDPRGALRQAGLNVPDGMTDARDMAMYLMDSGQIVGPRLQMARQMMARMGLK